MVVMSDHARTRCMERSNVHPNFVVAKVADSGVRTGFVIIRKYGSLALLADVRDYVICTVYPREIKRIEKMQNVYGLC